VALADLTRAERRRRGTSTPDSPRRQVSGGCGLDRSEGIPPEPAKGRERDRPAEAILSIPRHDGLVCYARGIRNDIARPSAVTTSPKGLNRADLTLDSRRRTELTPCPWGQGMWQDSHMGLSACGLDPTLAGLRWGFTTRGC